MSSQIERSASRLLEEHQQGVKFSNLSGEFGIAGLADAYEVQDRFVAFLTQRHGEPCGYKIGLTSQPMQEMCGIDEPIAGVVHANRMMATGASIECSAYGRPGIEFEIAVKLGEDLGDSGTPITRADVASAVSGVAAAFEIIDDRNADYTDLDVLSLIADNSWSAGAVVGTFLAPPADLAAVSGTVVFNGTEVATGRGSAALGHPFEPVRWLAEHLSQRNRRLRKGDVVLTGSLVRTMFPAAGDRFEFTVDGIGSVAVEFGA